MSVSLPAAVRTGLYIPRVRLVRGGSRAGNVRHIR